jgi:histone H3/H4
MVTMFVGTSIQQSIGDLATSLCPSIVISPDLPPELAWSMLCGALQRPLMVIGDATGNGQYFTPCDGEVVVHQVRCDVATAEAISTDEVAKHFPLTDAAVLVIMTHENNLFEQLLFTAHEDVDQDPPKKQGIGRNDVRRLSRRGGTKRMKAGFTEEVNSQLREYLRTILHDTTAVVEMQGKKTVQLDDVLYVLQKNKQTMYT